MRIRLPFAGVFLLLCLLAGYAGLSSLQLGAYVNDKALHLLTFFVLTAVFYWVVDTTRRRAVHFTVVCCTLAGGIGSEFLQAAIPNGREFDVVDIAANLAGSLAALGICAWYHHRMLERRRLAARSRYNAVPGEDVGDLELGEDVGLAGGQEEGVIFANESGGGGAGRTLENEVDNWDENELDSWDEDDENDDLVGSASAGGIGKSIGGGTKAELNGLDAADAKKRVD